MLPSKKMNKYNAKKTEVNGITFASKGEAKRYNHLLLLEEAKAISDLQLQPKFLLQDKFICNGEKVRAINYIADFSYIENGKQIVEDFKGVETEVFKLKKKLFLFKYGEIIELRIIK